MCIKFVHTSHYVCRMQNAVISIRFVVNYLKGKVYFYLYKWKNERMNGVRVRVESVRRDYQSEDAC